MNVFGWQIVPKKDCDALRHRKLCMKSGRGGGGGEGGGGGMCYNCELTAQLLPLDFAEKPQKLRTAQDRFLKKTATQESHRVISTT